MEIEEVQTAPDDDNEPITWDEVSYADKAVVDEMLVQKRYTYKTAEEISKIRIVKDESIETFVDKLRIISKRIISEHGKEFPDFAELMKKSENALCRRLLKGIKATAQSQCTHLELDELARDLVSQRVQAGLSLTVDSVVSELCAPETKDLFEEPSLSWANPSWTGKYLSLIHI